MLAIVIPYYKITFFEFTLESLATQTDHRFTVYIGDDNSSEKPIELLKKYKNQFDFVYYHFNENLGSVSLTKQWERSINLSVDEKWVMILGDDDVLDNNVVEEFYKNLEEVEDEKINVIRFSTFKIDEKNRIISEVYLHPKIEKATDFLFRDKRSSLSEYIFRKDKILEVGFKNFPLGWCSDLLAILEFSKFGEIFTINTAIFKIRISNSSISGDQSNLKLKYKANFEFYYYLTTKKSIYFTKEQNKILLFTLSKCYINDKRKISYFFKISKIFLSKFLIKDFFGFINTILYNYFRKK